METDGAAPLRWWMNPGRALLGSMQTLKQTEARKLQFWRRLAVLPLAAVVIPICGLAETGAKTERIKDVTTIESIRDNQLVGYGLVVGLRGTGDSSQTVFPAQTLISALERLGVRVPPTGSNSASNMQIKNTAGVFVVATLPPFSQPGFAIDVTV